ncbi:MAG: alpha/beta hydrolase [bacterium]
MKYFRLAVFVMVWAAVGSLFIGMATASQDAVEELWLWEKGAPGIKGDNPEDEPRLFLYPAPEDTANGAAVIICPGGGYGGLAMDHEGHQVARWLNTIGISGFILKYRHAPNYRHPVPLNDALRAIRLVRTNAEKWSLDTSRIGILGFSAGGHLASTAATHFNEAQTDSTDPVDQLSSRPDFVVLGYPVISFVSDVTHVGSRRNLLGDNPDPELVRSLSSELQVTSDTPPTFLFHSADDKGVPVQNSIMFFEAMLKHGVPGQLHIYEQGGHGYGINPKNPLLQSWTNLLADWFKARGILEKTDN